MKPLDIGISSYNNPDRLDATINSIRAMTTGEWRLLIFENASEDPGVHDVIKKHMDEDSRICVKSVFPNVKYAGAVNGILDWAETQYVAYCDNDVVIHTYGWNEALERILETNHEVAMAFPNGGAVEMRRTGYTEVLWGVGFCWMLKKARFEEIGGFDTEIGHQQECDYSLRLRLAGWKLAADKNVAVQHFAMASTDPTQKERINQGVIDFVNKWNRYFCGPNVNYHSPNVLRWEDWHPNALYLEEYYKQFVPELNKDAEIVSINGTEIDLIRVPRYKWLYRDRII